ncbi:MAG: hypothetical protein M1130_10165 [Actinobacteria bacterium]|nr:hypothetical protein [Actinomycetota bacterium]
MNPDAIASTINRKRNKTIAWHVALSQEVFGLLKIVKEYAAGIMAAADYSHQGHYFTEGHPYLSVSSMAHQSNTFFKSGAAPNKTRAFIFILN